MNMYVNGCVLNARERRFLHAEQTVLYAHTLTPHNRQGLGCDLNAAPYGFRERSENAAEAGRMRTTTHK